jgi:carboxymethylenebutenolidase
MPTVTLDAPAGPLEALLSVPSTGEGPWPGVVLVHDAFGFTDDIKNISRRVADAGYLVVAPRLFGRGGPGCVPKVFRALLTKQGDAVDDLHTAREFLAARAECTGAVGIAGFCMGGGFSLVMSPKGFAASAPFYGVPLPRPLDETLRGACPVVASFGAKDPMGRGAAKKLEAELTAQNIPHDVKEYPGVGHSFANELAAQPLMRIVGFGYDQAATDDAWNRVFAFFSSHLR